MSYSELEEYGYLQNCLRGQKQQLLDNQTNIICNKLHTDNEARCNSNILLNNINNNYNNNHIRMQIRCHSPSSSQYSNMKEPDHHHNHHHNIHHNYHHHNNIVNNMHKNMHNNLNTTNIITHQKQQVIITNASPCHQRKSIYNLLSSSSLCNHLNVSFGPHNNNNAAKRTNFNHECKHNLVHYSCKSLLLFMTTITIILLSSKTTTHLSESLIVAPSQIVADHLPIFSSSASAITNNNNNNGGNGGASQCPLSPSCFCKWSNGKQIASCDRRQLTNVPNNLPSEIQVLSLVGNNIEQLPKTVFYQKHLTNLQKIHLAQCKINHIAEDAFAYLTNLIELDLSYNNLTQVPIKALEHLKPSLRKLILSGNQIQSIEPNTFAGFSQLMYLDLSHNQIQHLKPGALNGLASLNELKLNDNRLSTLSPESLIEPTNYLNIDLYNNQWYCDCNLRHTMEWMHQHQVQQTLAPICTTPEQHKDKRWINIKPDDFVCPPAVLNRATDLVVGVGSNVTLACPARGTKPLQFVWFQDEKNITTPKSNSSEAPPTTKLLEERRYEISEEISVEDGQNVTTSILYLFNLNLSDTSIFLCWVENKGGYSMSNFSITVTPDGPISGQNVPIDNSAWSSLLNFTSNGDSSLGIILIACVIFLALILVLLFVIRSVLFSDRSSKDSQTSRDSIRKTHNNNTNVNRHSNLSNINAGPHSAKLNSRIALAESDPSDCDENVDDYADDDQLSSGSPCEKMNPKLLAAGELNGFMEQMRSGIINMEHHSMSPVIQFNNNANNNNTLKKNTINQHHMHSNSNNNFSQQQQYHHGQPMHHFATPSNASQQNNMIQYYPGDGGRSASMTTTTSDLSPGSRASNGGPIGGYHSTMNSYSSGAPTITNCDLQQQQQQLLHNNVNSNIDQQAPATNTTTTSCTSDYQAGYIDENNQINMIPPSYMPYDSQHQQTIHVSEEQLHIPATIYNPTGPIMVAPPPIQQRHNLFGQPMNGQQQQQQPITLVSMQDMMQQHQQQGRPATSHMVTAPPPNQRNRQQNYVHKYGELL